MAWAAIGAATISTVGGALLSDGGGGSASGMADPFASERPQYMAKLSALMNGSYGPDDPSYKFRYDQGLEAVNRSMAAGGYMNSGRQLTALTDYGQGMASTEFANQYTRLARLAGADIGSPATAAQLQYSQNQQDQTAINAALGAAGNAFGNWINGSSSSVDMTGFYDPSRVGSRFSSGAPAYADPLPVDSSTFGAGWMS